MTDSPQKPAHPVEKFNLERLSDDLRYTLVSAFNDLAVEGAADLTVVANEIAPALAVAAASGDEELTEELRVQIDTILEINQIRISAAALNTVFTVSQIVLRAAAAGLTTLVSGGIA